MRATDLSPEIWNAIADQIGRSSVAREVVFAVVTRVDNQKKHLFCDDFGDVAIPLVCFTTTFTYYDTQADGTVAFKGDKTQQNTAYWTQIVMPKVGDVVAILDLAGSRTYPICIGVLQSAPGFWEE